MMMSAPARFMPVSASRTTARSSSQPFWAAAMIIAYSPLTLYTATGTFVVSYDPANDVEIRQGGLDHDNVRSLLDIQLDFEECFVGVGRVHLVAAPVAEGGCALGGLPERSV